MPQEIAEAVNSKRRSDELQFAQLASRGVATAPIKSGRAARRTDGCFSTPSIQSRNDEKPPATPCIAAGS